jgi:hypothetical protein
LARKRDLVALHRVQVAALVAVRNPLFDRWSSFAPPSALPGISPTRGEIGSVGDGANWSTLHPIRQYLFAEELPRQTKNRVAVEVGFQLGCDLV